MTPPPYTVAETFVSGPYAALRARRDVQSAMLDKWASLPDHHWERYHHDNP